MTERLGDAPKPPPPHPAPGAFQATTPRRHTPRAPGRKRPAPPPRSPALSPPPRAAGPAFPGPAAGDIPRPAAPSCNHFPPQPAAVLRTRAGTRPGPPRNCPRRPRRSSSGSEQQSRGPHPPEGQYPPSPALAFGHLKNANRKGGADKAGDLPTTVTQSNGAPDSLHRLLGARPFGKNWVQAPSQGGCSPVSGAGPAGQRGRVKCRREETRG